jgi:hypothetical protein
MCRFFCIIKQKQGDYMQCYIRKDNPSDKDSEFNATFDTAALQLAFFTVRYIW